MTFDEYFALHGHQSLEDVRDAIHKAFRAGYEAGSRFRPPETEADRRAQLCLAAMRTVRGWIQKQIDLYGDPCGCVPVSYTVATLRACAEALGESNPRLRDVYAAERRL